MHKYTFVGRGKPHVGFFRGLTKRGKRTVIRSILVLILIVVGGNYVLENMESIRSTGAEVVGRTLNVIEPAAGEGVQKVIKSFDRHQLNVFRKGHENTPEARRS
jgi:hypothetical protein